MPLPFERIQALAHAIVERFQPQKIILFGSYAWGTPTDESDVDLLVVMNALEPSKPAFYAAAKIRYALPRDIAIDVLVRDPEDYAARVRDFDGFLSTIAQQGVLLYQQEGLLHE